MLKWAFCEIIHLNLYKKHQNILALTNNFRFKFYILKIYKISYKYLIFKILKTHEKKS